MEDRAENFVKAGRRMALAGVVVGAAGLILLRMRFAADNGEAVQ